MLTPRFLSAVLLAGFLSCQSSAEPQRTSEGQNAGASHPPTAQSEAAPLHDPREVHLANIRQLTFGGENAEGYFREDGKRIVLQARGGDTGFDCDQIFELDLETGERRLVSTGKGRTTCAFFHAGDQRILYASTHLVDEKCPPEPDRSRGYVWPIYASYDIFSVAADEPSDLVRLTATPGYDAEATYCAATARIVFTSVRDGDLELYSMNDDGSDVRRITEKLGYDGGAFFSKDGSKIVWRAQYPESESEEQDYLALLRQGLVRPTRLEIWVANADGSEARQITNDGKANFAPYFFPDGNRVIYASNVVGPREFHLYATDVDGTDDAPERITYSSRFNSFPMFSPDGKRLIFASNRSNEKPNETNLFVADWRRP